jgi:tRNA(Ile)-lysidine synthase
MLLPGYPDIRVCVALSGGVDSTALLAALAMRHPKALKLRAVHVSHGLHPEAPRWSAHCSEFASRLGVPLDVCLIKVPRSSGESLEAVARQMRYERLAKALRAGEILLTAHHEDDQLETVLLQLFRGAGIAGLSAMPQIARFANGWLARPLLSRTRQELEAWTRAEGLTWVEDETNADEGLDRNYLRRQVLPLIRARWRGAAAAVSRSARHAAEAQQLLNMLGRADVERAMSGAALWVPALRGMQPDRRRNALRFWIGAAGARVPDTRRLDELAGPVISARADANPRVTWGNVVVQRHADLLSLTMVAARRGGAHAPAEKNIHPAIEWSWHAVPVLKLPGAGGRLELKPDVRGPIDLDALPATVSIRARAGGERLRPRRGGPRRALKSLLQEAHLAIAERTRLPLVFAQSRLVAVGALWLDESIQALPGAPHRGRLIWHVARSDDA